MAYKRGVYAEILPSKTKYFKPGKVQNTANSGTGSNTNTNQYTAKLGTSVLGKMILGKAK